MEWVIGGITYMTKTDSILLYLLHLSLGSIDDGADMCNVSQEEWLRIVDLSFDQNVAAIAVDGLQKFYENNPNLELAIDKEEVEDLKYEWFGEILRAEDEYARHKSVFSDLVKTLSNQGIRILLLKGIGLSNYYPIPSHRPTGDFDIYSYGHHLEINQYFTANGVEVDDRYVKHSVFDYKGVTVENHSIYLDSFLTRCERRVQAYLESLDDDVLNANGYYTPSALKNYLFLLCHTTRHFSEFESIRLRHILDWGLFLKSEIVNMDLPLIRAKLKEFGLEKTNNLFVSLAEKVCGFDFSELLFERLREAECERVLSYILSEKRTEKPNHLIPRIWYKLKNLASNNWKYRYLSITMAERVWYSIKLHLAGSAEI